MKLGSFLRQLVSRLDTEWDAHCGERLHLELVTAKHLLERGIEPGPHMGELLRRAERIAIEEDPQSSEAILHRL
jgi:hypothetical protein